MNIEIIIVLGTFFFLVLLWGFFGYHHLKSLKDKLAEQWELADEMLRKRQDLVPLLVETLRYCSFNDEEFVQKLISQRFEAAHLKLPDTAKIEAEQKLEDLLNDVMQRSEKEFNLGRDVKFLHIKKDLSSAAQTAKERLDHYDQMIEEFNKHVSSVYWSVWALVFNFKKLPKFSV